MSRRAYPVADRYEEIERDYYREPPSRPRSSAPYENLDIEVDIDRRSRAPPPPRTEYAPTEIRERERTRNVPDFLREDYPRSTAGPLVVRDEFIERDRSRQRPRERSEVEREEIKITERDRGDTRSRRGDDARSEIRSIAPSRREEVREEIIETKSRAPEREWMPKRYHDQDREIDINIRERRDDDVRSRRGSPPRSVREVEREEITFRRGEVERRPRPREPEVEKEEIIIRRDEASRVSPPRSRARSVGAREREIDIDIKRRDISDSHSRVGKEKIEKEEIVFRPRDRGSPPRERSIPPPPQLVGREREEIIYRRRPEPPPPPREVEKEQIVIRQRRRSSPSPIPPPAPPPPVEEREQIIIRQRRQRTPSPSPSPSPPPPPPAPEPIIQPPIRQEIIREIVTHHRHIDHGVERARSPSPPPAPEPPKKEEKREEDLEIEIRRRGTRDGKYYDEDIIFEDRRRDTQSRTRSESLDTHRPRSASPARTERSERRVFKGEERDDISLEADYYNRKVSERAYMGEAYNGATKDWGIVDVPPGTRRVQMDGIGGGSQEITWQQYNGVRRGKFITRDQEFDAEFETGRKSLPPPSEPEKPREEIRETRIDIRERESPRGGTELIRRDEVYKPAPPKDMWTEITKDLVIKEAIEEMGYDYEETEPFFYVMEYLKYDDVLRLVELSEQIRHQRRDRIRDIQWEREEIKDRDRWEVEHRPKHDAKYEDVIYEREVYEETGPRRHRYRY